jgi:hypothetical protein
VTDGVHDWRCICGLGWEAIEHLRRLSLTGGRWRGNPSSLDPWDQWCRENLPAGKAGIVYSADDGILRSFTEPGSLGCWAKVEHKGRAAKLGRADLDTLRAVSAPGRALHPLVVTSDADVPTALYHWPHPCRSCGAPGPVPRASSTVTVTVIQPKGRSTVLPMHPDRLRSYLMLYLQHRAER